MVATQGGSLRWLVGVLSLGREGGIGKALPPGQAQTLAGFPVKGTVCMEGQGSGHLSLSETKSECPPSPRSRVPRDPGVSQGL